MRLSGGLRSKIEPGRREDDRGVVLILVALAMVGILVMAALVLDFSVVRQTRQGNKSAADFAVTSGLRGLETAEGIPRPWGGVCTALEYLKANHEDLASLTGTFKNGAGTAFAADPCLDTTATPYTTLCGPGNLATWAWFSGTANGGKLLVEIKSGYALPDPDFPEDSGAYSADNAGDPLQGGCDQLAVILRETDSALFGGAAGATKYDTAIRSVGRVKIGSISEEAVALLLLEARDCETLVTEGNNTYVLVRATPIGAPTKPGLIQSNSDATGDCSGGNKIIEGSSACPAISNCSGAGPSVVAENAATPGKIGVRAVGGALQGFVSTPACATPTAGCTVSPVPINRGTVSRAPVDARYLAHARALKTTATSAGPAGYFVVSGAGCNNSLFSTATTGGNPRVYLDCSVTVGAGGVTFDDTITDVVITGSLTVGPGRTLIASNVRNFIVKGAGGIDVSGVFRINERTATSCTDRYTAFPSVETTKLVVLDGPFEAGSSGAEVDLCNTFLFLANGALPATNGTPPSNNAFNGRINIGSSASLDWKAPNQSDGDRALTPGDPLFADFEDMALWTEFSGSSVGTAPGIGGQGAVVTTGVFFLPNANPFSISGGGAGAVLQVDAQFIVRKLKLSGTVALSMAPNPNNAVPTPVFEGFGLIR